MPRPWRFLRGGRNPAGDHVDIWADWRIARPDEPVIHLITLAQTPSPSPTVLESPPADPIQVAGAIIAIVLALAAGILGYRIIRGGRGL
jgi:hypothetical protein